jgi:hypothetical protein
MSEKEIHGLDIRLTTVETQLESMSHDLSGILTGINRLLWLIGGGFLMSGVAWVIQGGLA